MDTVLLKNATSKIGKILKGYREKTRQNQSDVAVKASISVSMLSQIERGIVAPSIETLMQVCFAIGLEPADLFKRLSTERPVRIHHCGERLTMVNGGVTYEQLMVNTKGPYQAEMFILIVEQGDKTTLSTSHDGVEMGYVLGGSAILTIDNVDYPIREGDSVYFNSQLTHQIYNNGDKEFKAVWSISPPHVDYFSSFEEHGAPES
ncbi:MAG: helix-turn-helix transcriptional regulator [Chitinispirillaceae bacterium]|nr:helix-turn-helix transcriptional regulator [Chitinispirillaceae bacterium]